MLSCRDAHALGRSDCPSSRPHTSPALTHIDAATCSIFRFRGTRPAPHLPQLGRVSVRAGVHGGCRPGGTRQGWARTVAAATARLDDGACPSVGASGPRSDALFLSFYCAIGFSSSSFPHHAQTATLPLWFRASHEERKRVNLFVHTHQTHHHIHTRCRNPPHTHPPIPTRNNRHTHADKPEGG